MSFAGALPDLPDLATLDEVAVLLESGDATGAIIFGRGCFWALVGALASNIEGPAL